MIKSERKEELSSIKIENSIYQTIINNNKVNCIRFITNILNDNGINSIDIIDRGIIFDISTEYYDDNIFIEKLFTIDNYLMIKVSNGCIYEAIDIDYELIYIILNDIVTIFNN